jgi:hypothetical protein
LARTVWRLGIQSPRRRLFWSLVGMALRRSLRHLPWAVEKAIQGEHFLRYTVEDVLPRLRQALEDVCAERASGRTASSGSAAPMVATGGAKPPGM